jgi:hypothetical protein
LRAGDEGLTMDDQFILSSNAVRWKSRLSLSISNNAFILLAFLNLMRP